MKLPDDWKYIKLSDITTPLTEMAGDKKYETLSISAGIGFVNQAKKFGKELSGKQYEKYTVLQRGDFSYNKGNSKKYPQGCIYQLTDRDCAAVPNVFESFRFILGINDYYEQLFMSGFLNHQLASRINHGVRDDGLLNLTGKDFYDCFVPSPPLAEQQKIAEILCRQDKIISLKQKLLEQKQKQKKWLMQKLLEVPLTDANDEEKFSLDGVVIDKSGWKKERLESIFFEVNERNHPNESVLTIVQGYGTDYRSNVDRRINYDKANVTSYKAVQEGDFIIHLRSFEGGLEMANQNGIVSPAYIILRLKKNLYNIFLYFLFHSHEFIYRTIAKSVEGIRDGRNVKYESLKKQEIYLPTLPEQKIIAQVLSTADKEIALLKSSIEQEKQKKKSLAQLLLTGTVRVKT